MTSLNRNEFEALCKVFGQIWDEKTGQLEKDPRKGGRQPILRSAEERLFFILFYLKTYPLQEVLAHLLGMSQGQAHFLIDYSPANSDPDISNNHLGISD